MNEERLNDLKNMTDLLNARLALAMKAKSYKTASENLTKYANALLEQADHYTELSDKVDGMVNSVDGADHVKAVNEFIKRDSSNWRPYIFTSSRGGLSQLDISQNEIKINKETNDTFAEGTEAAERVDALKHKLDEITAASNDDEDEYI
jgi:hypothetical protein